MTDCAGTPPVAGRASSTRPTARGLRTCVVLRRKNTAENFGLRMRRGSSSSAYDFPSTGSPAIDCDVSRRSQEPLLRFLPAANGGGAMLSSVLRKIDEHFYQ